MTRTTIILLAALFALAPAAEARTKTTFTIRGAGFGHGVGMSQYGAMGFAQQGRSAAEILAHYYTGTALGTTDPKQQVRVLLTDTRTARVTGARQAGSRKLDPDTTYTIQRRGLSQVDLSARGRRVATFTAPLQIAGENGITGLSGHGRYRGVLEFEPNVFNGVRVINRVALDEYLKGVVPAESPASWPAEALKAQAIAARTYAITTAKSTDFDHYADTRSQVYKGVGIEHPATNQAVEDTRGQVVTYEGEPIVTYFFSTSGGRTESVENTTLGNEPKPWLKSVEDPYDDVSPRHRWKVRTKKSTVARKLRGLVKGSFKGIRVTRRGESPRIVTAEIVGSRGVTKTDGATLRARLGLYDTWASFTSISSRRGKASGAATASASAYRPWAVGALRGTVIGPPRGTKLRVQVRRDGKWRDVATVRTGKNGAYRYAAPARGTYRVLTGGAAGPAVRIG